MPRARLGQHFLQDRTALRAVAAALHIAPGDTVIEIGAGHGELTDELRVTSERVENTKIIAIEKDPALATLLRNKYAERKNFQVIEGDARKVLLPLILSLSTLPSSFVTHRSPLVYKVCGNIPYYLTGFLLRIIGELTPHPVRTVFTMQKEVAERICAQPKRMNPVRSRGSLRALAASHGMNPVRSSRAAVLRTRDRVASATSHGMNQLAASVQFWACPEIIRTLPRTAFRPPPEVASAIIALQSRTYADSTRNDAERVSAEAYYAAVRALFRHPRKTLVNNITEATGFMKGNVAAILREQGISPNARPGGLTVAQIIKLATRFHFNSSFHKGGG